MGIACRGRWRGLGAIGLAGLAWIVAAGSVSAQSVPGGAVRRTRVVDFDATQFVAATNAEARPIRIELFDGRAVDAVVERVEPRGEGRFTVFATLPEFAHSSFVLVVNGSVLAGGMQAPGLGRFDLVTQPDGRTALREFAPVDASDYCGAVATPPQPRGVAPCPNARSLLAGYAADDGATVDVMVYYTAAARDAAGGVPQIEASIDLATATANQAYATSLITPRIRIIRKALIAYAESGDGLTDLNRLVDPADGFMDSVHAERDAYGADLVSLWVATLNTGGVAYQPFTFGPDDDGRSTFSVVRQDQAAFETFAHEVGHNFGTQHDRGNEQGVPLLPYGYGYREPGAVWKTIMAYPPGTTILNFANPNVNYNGPLGHPGPTGVPGDDPMSSCDVARAHNKAAWTLANFRPATLAVPPTARLYVRPAGPVNGDGSSWANAMRDVQQAIGVAVASRGVVQEVWVAAGTYRPNRNVTDALYVRTISFRLVNGVSIYGGFAGTETLLSQRNIAANPTILSGDIGISGDASDNTYHVLNGNDLNATAVLDGFTITGGNANGSGYPHDGGGGMLSICGAATIRNCTFTGNSGAYGGAVRLEQSGAASFVSCTLTANTATALGGGMYVWASTPSLNGCAFDNNVAPDSGGIYFGGGATPTLTSCTIRNHVAPWGAGAGSFEASPTFVQCTFQDNAAVNGGGGLYAGGASTPVFTNCTFQSNSAGFGGGLYCYDGANAQVSGGMFVQNSSPSGGGVYLYNASPTISGVTFGGNVAGSGGSGAAGAIGAAAGSAGTVSDCSFSANSAGCCGGAVATFGSPLLVQRCTFTMNMANYGAGVWNADASAQPPRIVNSRFFGNIAQWGGGALHASNGTAPVIVNGVFSGNQAPAGYGGAAFNVGGSAPSFVNCSFSRNTAAFGGGGLWNDASTVSAANSIFWQNSDPGGTNEAAQISNFNAATISVTRCIVQGWTGGLGGTANHGSNPLFVDSDGPDNVVGNADDNLRVQYGSPAIDSGNNASVPVGTTTDADGNSRFANVPCITDTGAGTPPIVDRGAYEYSPLAEVLGDFDSNGMVNSADVPVFVAVLVGHDTGASHVAAADMNCDGRSDGRDVQMFVQRVLGM